MPRSRTTIARASSSRPIVQRACLVTGAIDLFGGGRRIRTAGPPLRRGAFLNRLLQPLQPAKPVETEVFDPRGTGGSNPSSSTRESARTLALYDAFVRGRRLSALRVRILRAPSRRNEPGLWLPLVFSVRLPRFPAAGVTVVWKRGLILMLQNIA